VLIAAVYVDQSRRAAALRGARSRGLFKRRGSQRGPKERKTSEP
jgi:ribose transport system permease protein